MRLNKCLVMGRAGKSRAWVGLGLHKIFRVGLGLSELFVGLFRDQKNSLGLFALKNKFAFKRFWALFNEIA